jgi:hypothetical protein
VPRPLNVVVQRLQEALASEYPPGTVTITAFDARALLALLDAGPMPDAELPDEIDDGV